MRNFVVLMLSVLLLTMCAKKDFVTHDAPASPTPNMTDSDTQKHHTTIKQSLIPSTPKTEQIKKQKPSDAAAPADQNTPPLPAAAQKTISPSTKILQPQTQTTRAPLPDKLLPHTVSYSKYKEAGTYTPLLWIFILLILLFIAFWIIKKALKITAKYRQKLKESRSLRQAIMFLLLAVIAWLIYGAINTFTNFTITPLFDAVYSAGLVALITMFISQTLNFIQEKFLVNTPYDKYFTSIKLIVLGMFLLIVFVHMFSKHEKYIFSFIAGAGMLVAYVDPQSIFNSLAVLWLQKHNMLKVGDWIEIESKQVDGMVVEMKSSFVKIRQWDNTLIIVPAYMLLNNSFKSWAQTLEEGKRRVKRALNIDINSIRSAGPDFMNSLPQAISSSLKINPQSNLRAFIEYCSDYVKNHAAYHKDDVFLIRELQPSQNGLPLEFYFFINVKSWEEYEAAQSEMFEYILAVAPMFGLRIHQNLAGADFQKLQKN